MPRLLAAVAAAALLFSTSSAAAGGFFLTDRGVVPMGRGFASVAGVRDPQALWYNPAGLAWSGRQLLFDSSMTLLNGNYTRVDGGGATLPTIKLGQQHLPIPALAYSQPLNKDLTLGLGMFAPNALLMRYPYNVDSGGRSCSDPNAPGCQAAPQRYSLYNMNGSLLVNLIAALAWMPVKGLSFGLGGQLMVGTFQAEVAMSACDGAICTQPENPEFDGVARITMFPVVEPALTAGITYDLNGKVRFAASMLWWVNALSGRANLDVRLPPASFFDGAYVDGNKAKLNIPFPLTVRTGIEVTPIRQLSIETAFVWEQWSSQKAITITPQNMWIRNVIAVGDYQVGPINIPRNMNNVYSVRVGAEYRVMDQLVVRAGYNYENSSFNNAYLTPLTIDSRKHILGMGLSAQLIRGVWLDVSYAHVFMADPVVTNSQVYQPNAIRPTTTAQVTPIGNGTYNMEANMFGIGLRWQIDVTHPPPPPSDTIGSTMEAGLDREMRQAPAGGAPADGGDSDPATGGVS